MAHYSDGGVPDDRRSERALKKLARLRRYKPIGTSPVDPSPYGIVMTARFERDIQDLKKRGTDLALLENVIGMLARGADLRSVHHSRISGGHMSSWREYRLESGLSLIYSTDGPVLILLAIIERPAWT